MEDVTIKQIRELDDGAYNSGAYAAIDDGTDELKKIKLGDLIAPSKTKVVPGENISVTEETEQDGSVKYTITAEDQGGIKDITAGTENVHIEKEGDRVAISVDAAEASNIFVAVYGETTYEEVTNAVAESKAVMLYFSEDVTAPLPDGVAYGRYSPTRINRGTVGTLTSFATSGHGIATFNVVGMGIYGGFGGTVFVVEAYLGPQNEWSCSIRGYLGTASLPTPGGDILNSFLLMFAPWRGDSVAMYLNDRGCMALPQSAASELFYYGGEGLRPRIAQAISWDSTTSAMGYVPLPLYIPSERTTSGVKSSQTPEYTIIRELDESRNTRVTINVTTDSGESIAANVIDLSLLAMGYTTPYSYEQGMLVSYENLLWYCVNSYAAADGESFNRSNWNTIPIANLAPFRSDSWHLYRPGSFEASAFISGQGIQSVLALNRRVADELASFSDGFALMAFTNNGGGNIDASLNLSQSCVSLRGSDDSYAIIPYLGGATLEDLKPAQIGMPIFTPIGWYAFAASRISRVGASSGLNGENLQLRIEPYRGDTLILKQLVNDNWEAIGQLLPPGATTPPESAVPLPIRLMGVDDDDGIAAFSSGDIEAGSGSWVTAGSIYDYFNNNNPVVLVSVTVDYANVATADKTAADVQTAITNKKNVLLRIYRESSTSYTDAFLNSIYNDVATFYAPCTYEVAVTAGIMLGFTKITWDLANDILDLAPYEYFVQRIQAGTDLKLEEGVMSVDTEGTATGKDAFVLGGPLSNASGDYSLAGGADPTKSYGEPTVASGSMSIAWGAAVYAKSIYSRAYGYRSRAQSKADMDENGTFDGNTSGYLTKDIKVVWDDVKEDAESINGSYQVGEGAVVGGAKCLVIGARSEASGNTNLVTGCDSKASNSGNEVYGNYAHAEGRGNQCWGNAQSVFGKYNDPMRPEGVGDNSPYLEIVGNGTSASNRSNARTLDKNGNERIAGEVYPNKGTKSYTDLINEAMPVFGIVEF